MNDIRTRIRIICRVKQKVISSATEVGMAHTVWDYFASRFFGILERNSEIRLTWFADYKTKTDWLM